jgi:SAM-dependent methyltransferase
MNINTIEARRDCPVCESSRLSACFWLQVEGVRIQWDRCRACRLTFQNPRLDLPTIQAIYASDEYWGKGPSTSQTTYVDYEKFDAVRWRQSRRRLRLISEATNVRSGELLDVGCATGFFGHIAQEQGFRVTGIEPSPQMADFARKSYGLKIHTDILEHIELCADSYDVVTLWGTDSHFLHPREGFAKLVGALKPGGILAMNYQDFTHWLRVLLPGIKRNWNALFLLSRQTLEHLFAALGLDILYHKTEWQWTSLGHVCRVAKMPYPRRLGSLVLPVPALSFPLVIARKRLVASALAA